MQAIITKYIGPTNHRGARVKACSQAGAVMVPWDDALSVDENHTRAAVALAKKWGWNGRWVGGAMPSGEGNCYVCAERAYEGFFTVAKVDK